MVSTWRRMPPSCLPTAAKACGQYINSQLARMEAAENGYDEAILLTQDGHVAEGSGENSFLVKDNILITPPPSDNILEGITRQTVIQLAQAEMGINTIERHVDRSELYLADECFFTGTAANIAPIAEIAGCYANVVGLPLCHLTRCLRAWGVEPPADIPSACQAHTGYQCTVYAAILAGQSYTF